MFWQRDEHDLALEELTKAVTLDPSNVHALLALAIYFQPRSTVIALNIYRRILQVSPGNQYMIARMLPVLVSDQKYLEAERLLKDIKDTEYRYYQLAYISRLQGRNSLAARYERMADDATWLDTRNETRKNYNEVLRKLRSRGILPVLVQYPMCGLNKLKEIVDDSRGIIFVDNGPSFKSAVSKKGYDTFFSDRFGGNFGHATEEGNKLLARNIGAAILAHVNAGRK